MRTNMPRTEYLYCLEYWDTKGRWRLVRDVVYHSRNAARYRLSTLNRAEYRIVRYMPDYDWSE
jgi:hypothetical protein